MTGERGLSTETKTTLVFMVLGLTAWYLAQQYLENQLVELVALFGVGIVLPTLLNEVRRQSEE
ncbi:hypothetical protein NKF06_00660 [Haloferax sp. AB510]|uniref:hypothetical protein n=1 Tax=Haloferax sp. AB510 TaxID=2934172 RepID=UPI00209C447B|nr:hypothetical protein [Haloferax sp. AB510]MCO8265132.1 hypothetical protein [Haloferax sp. AB510]